MSYVFRHSICNEVYEKRPFAETCRSVRAAGYTGIEIAPFTLAEDATTIPASRRREYADAIRSEGLQFAGLHWLMVSPKGLHVTTADPTLRNRSWAYVRGLVDLCADLGGPGGVMVFGSPKQRGSTGGISAADAKRNYIDGLAGVAPHAAARGVTILVEALPTTDTDVITTLDDAAEVVKQISSPGVRTMFDSHNAVLEKEPHATLVERHFDLIRHVHVNEMDGRHPGTGEYDFKPVFEVLARHGYKGWISLEVFDFSLGADRIAAESLRYLESEIAKLPAEVNR
ncbi:MAG TPA: sugar phosphate isomerase/epimerase family protein [Bryobacteraceae bacterium]|nr:sugar phosphate isomerase/epimerase family protein [Bryobacteraceae bacterium]